MFYPVIQQFGSQLVALSAVLRKATAHAEARKFNPDNFVGLRLAPDMFPLVKQVQVARDVAKVAAGTFGRKEIPKFVDDETTMDAIFKRIEKTQSYLQQFKAEDFASTGLDDVVPIPFPKGKSMRAQNALLSRALPNFYFHVVTAYDILRAAGVDVGKLDYLGTLQFVDP